MPSILLKEVSMPFLNVTDAVGVEYTINTGALVLLRDAKNVHELVFSDGSKINLKPEEAARVKGLLAGLGNPSAG